MKRWWLPAVALAALLVSCGGGGSVSRIPPPGSTPPAQRGETPGNAGRMEDTSAVRPGPPVAVSPQETRGNPLGPEVWSRWRSAWQDLDRRQGSEAVATMAQVAELDASRRRLEDSILAGVRSLESGGVPGSDLTRWIAQYLRHGLAEGRPRHLELFSGGSTVEVLRPFNADLSLTLTAALSLASDKRWDEAARVLRSFPAHEEERAHAASLLMEVLRASGDTMRAGAGAESLLARSESWPEWARADLESAAIEAHLAAGDTAGARRRIESFSARGDRRGFWLLASRRLARLRGQEEKARALTWQVVEEYPGGGTAHAVLRALVPESSDASRTIEGSARTEGSQPGPSLSRLQMQALLRVCEIRGDLRRFRSLEASLRPSLDPGEIDTVILRGMKLAYKAKEYGRLADDLLEGTWREPRAFSSEWALIAARAHRNTARPEVMAVWYGEVARKGGAEDRATAYWEWAREMESLRSFEAADSLYSLFLSGTPGDRRAAALVRRGICRFALRDWDRAARLLTEAREAGTGEDRDGARFWLYKVALARGDAVSARATLAEVGQGDSGYYVLRARSALQMARDGSRPAVTDASSYWEGLGSLAAAPDLGAARVYRRAPLEDGGERVVRLRDRLQLFRRCARSDWALMAREALEAELSRGGAGAPLPSLEALGFPDLAARAAVRSGGRRSERYPIPYPAEVASAAERFAVAPEWIWSIMRRESFFESSVVSGAGATGLMQLMEPTAKVTAEKHGLPRGPLRSPRINLELGTAHLRDLISEEPGRWPVILAAYNAGMNNAQRWVRPGEDEDLYVEMIGYRETREYVQRVLEGFWIYRGLLREGL